MYTYDPKQVMIIIGGAIMSGFSEGTFLTIEMKEDAFTTKVGADGETSRAKRNNNNADATLTLAQTSPSNDVLSAFAAADRLTGDGVVPFVVKDGSGRSLLFSAYAWVKKLPGQAYSANIEDRAWSFEIVDVDTLVGGNAPVVAG